MAGSRRVRVMRASTWVCMAQGARRRSPSSSGASCQWSSCASASRPASQGGLAPKRGRWREKNFQQKRFHAASGACGPSAQAETLGALGMRTTPSRPKEPGSTPKAVSSTNHRPASRNSFPETRGCDTLHCFTSCMVREQGRCRATDEDATGARRAGLGRTAPGGHPGQGRSAGRPDRRIVGTGGPSQRPQPRRGQTEGHQTADGREVCDPFLVTVRC